MSETDTLLPGNLYQGALKNRRFAYVIPLYLLLSLQLPVSFVHATAHSKTSIAQDSVSKRHLIPIEVFGWRAVFEVSKEDNLNEKGMIVYRFVIDQDGNLKELSPVSKNVSDQVEKAYRRKIKATWRVVGFKGKNPPELTQGDYMLHISPKN